MNSQAADELRAMADSDPERAWSCFLEDYTATIERAAGRVAKDPEEVRNLLVDVLERIWSDWPALLERYAKGSSRARFRPWLAVVARNLAIDLLRARYGRPTLPRSVERMQPVQQELYKLLYGERLTLPEAWERLAGGPWQGSFTELALEARDLEDGLPHSARVAAAGIRRPERGRGGNSDELPEGLPERAESRERPDDLVQHAAAHETLRLILKGLSGDERRLLRVYFLEGATARDVARLTGASSPSRVYDGVHSLLERMRDELRAAELGPEDLRDLMDFDWFENLPETSP